MAAISISSNIVQTNPTSLFVPYNNGNVFLDSILKMINSDAVATIQGSSAQGLSINNTSRVYSLGDIQRIGGGVAITLDSTSNTMAIEGASLIATSAGVAAMKYLTFTNSGITYKIALLNNTI
jgi:hypothetical protein